MKTLVPKTIVRRKPTFVPNAAPCKLGSKPTLIALGMKVRSASFYRSLRLRHCIDSVMFRGLRRRCGSRFRRLRPSTPPIALCDSLCALRQIALTGWFRRNITAWRREDRNGGVGTRAALRRFGCRDRLKARIAYSHIVLRNVLLRLLASLQTARRKNGMKPSLGVKQR